MKDVNPDSIRARLLNIAKSESLVFQELLNRYGAEQFLSRLSQSAFARQFVFKGGLLLAYIIESDRQTKDLDFTIREIGHQIEEAQQIVEQILLIPVNDGLRWLKPIASQLDHPEMDYPGVRLKCTFMLGKARGIVRIDLAKGDVVEPVTTKLRTIRYREKPLIGPDFEILAYPPESIFAEKLQIAVKRGANNTRMKDYYDLFKLAKSEQLKAEKLKDAVKHTFEKRSLKTKMALNFDQRTIEALQVFWTAFIKKMKVFNAPDSFKEVVHAIDIFLKNKVDR